MFLCTANLSAFEAILVSYMRPFFAFLGLLLCLIAIRADEQTVIKDSEAIRYVGRYVEVRGVVVSVTISPLGTAFINFGREHPRLVAFSSTLLALAYAGRDNGTS